MNGNKLAITMRTKETLRIFAMWAALAVVAVAAYSQNSEEEAMMSKDVLDQRGSLPRFPGGNEALVAFLSSNLDYPKEALANRESGTVLIQLKVEKSGKVSDVKVLRSVSAVLDAEALRVCKMLPDFIPGYVNGERVTVMHVLPIRFMPPED